jgi:short-subunit dehydrogenase involved in D-alanine esterification of teichoic acids
MAMTKSLPSNLTSRNWLGFLTSYPSIFPTHSITTVEKLTSFRVIKAHPTLDSVFLNSGIQKGLNFAKPETINLSDVGLEMTTNYISYIHLISYLLPFLQSKPIPTSLIFTTSGLALIPMLRCPNYCASKAAMHHLILAMRVQLENTNVKVIEILPPAVQTELHDAKHQPDIKDGGKIGMPLEEFTDKAWMGLCEGKTDIPVGQSEGPYQEGGWELERQKNFKGMVEAMKERERL